MSHNKNISLPEIAKTAVENYIETGEIIPPPLNSPKEFLDRKAGVFVTIKKNKKLRACVGTFLPTQENIAQEIIHSSIAAATEDYRFGPIREDELLNLSYIVYILSEPKKVKNIKDTLELSEENLKKAGLDPKKYGIIVKSGFKSGLLLPDLEGLDTAMQQVLIACQKANINPKEEEITIYKFTAEKYGK